MAETVHDLQERVERCLPACMKRESSLSMLLLEQQTVCKPIPQVPNHPFYNRGLAPDRPVGPGTSIRLISNQIT